MQSKMLFLRPIPLSRLTSAIGDKAQKNTQGYGGRPYGVGLIVAGVDETGPHIHECSPSGNVYDYHAVSIGARCQSAKTYLEKYYTEFPEASLQDLIVHGLRAIAETLQTDKNLTTANVSVGWVGAGAGESFHLVEDEDLTP